MDNYQKREITNGNFSKKGNLINLTNQNQISDDENNFGDDFKNFCENTSLHGFRYITAERKSIKERVIWSSVCLIFILIATSMMVLTMYRFSKTPTTTTIENMAYPIWDIPFPAITICNHNKVYLPTAKYVSEEMLKAGFRQEDIDRLFDLLPQLIRPALGNGNFTHVPAVLESFGLQMEELMRYLMHPCDKMLHSCSWLDRKYDCKKIFKTSKTSEGFCCSFNYHVAGKLLSDDYDKQSGYANETTKTDDEEIPGVNEIQMVPGAGRDFGLMVTFDVESQYYRGSIRPYIGASIMVHHPNEFPEVDLRSTIIQPSQEVTILLSGTIIESEPNVRNLHVDLRNCWFQDERKLNISPIYGYHSCVSECRIKFIVSNCNCVPFYYPNEIYPGTKTCGLEDINCLQSIRRNISELQTLNDVNYYDDDSNEKADCKCFPLCSDNWYTLNTESAHMEHFDHNFMLLNDVDINNISTAVIFFRDITCIKYKRAKWKSWNDVIGSLGGILGLCVGGSFVSVVEIIYFFIINRFLKKEVQEPPSKSINKKINISNVDHTKNTGAQSTFFIDRIGSPVKSNKTDEILHYFSNEK